MKKKIEKLKLVSIDKKSKNWRTKNWEILLREFKNEIYYYHKIWMQKYEIDEVPYYYSERTNISILASAATRKGYLTLEEYPVEKKSGRGRVDLWIGDRDLKFNEIIEAKQCWNINNLKNKTMAAKLDRSRVVADFDEYKASVVFVCHWLNENEKENAHSEIEKWILKSKNINYDIALYLFPRKFWNVHGSGKNKSIYFPGIIVLVSLAHKFK